MHLKYITTRILWTCLHREMQDVLTPKAMFSTDKIKCVEQEHFHLKLYVLKIQILN